MRITTGLHRAGERFELKYISNQRIHAQLIGPAEAKKILETVRGWADVDWFEDGNNWQASWKPLAL